MFHVHLLQQDKKIKRQQKASDSAKEYLKIVIVGDGCVGKTCVLITYTTNKYPMEYVPTIFDNYAVNVYVDGRPFTLGLFDTAGQDDYDRLRPLSYPETDCFMLCYSVENLKSLAHVADKWVPEIKKHCPTTPFVVVGLKADLRDDAYTIQKLAEGKKSPVTKEEGKAMAEKLGAYAYVECSSTQQKGVNNVFKEVVNCCLGARSEMKKKQCIIQ